MSVLDVTRAAFGGWLIARPRDALTAVRVTAELRAVVYTRVLGARHLAQALLASRLAGRRWRYGAAAVDGLHAVSSLTLAAHSNRHRPGLAANAVTAGAFVLADVASARGRERR